MAEHSAIEWTDHTFNPWVGCQRVSPGCTNCYAETYDKRVGGAPKEQRADPSKPQLRWGPTAARVRTSLALWRKPLKWNSRAGWYQGSLKRRQRVFCASLADVFDMHESIEHVWRLELFSLIRQTPELDWQLLTKRPQNFEIALRSALAISARQGEYVTSDDAFKDTRVWIQQWLDGKPPVNVGLGTTIEDQTRAEVRLATLVETPAAWRFLSCEPLLEHVRFDLADLARVDWMIIGGESGGKARRLEVAWVRSLLRQARATKVKPFVKQLGANIIDRNDAGFEAENETWAEGTDAGKPTNPRAWPTPKRIEENVDGYRDEYQGAPVRVHLRDRAGGDMTEWPHDLRVREFPEVRRV